MVGVMSDPIPSPSIKGIIGLSGITRFPEASNCIFSPSFGISMCLNYIFSIKFCERDQNYIAYKP